MSFYINNNNPQRPGPLRNSGCGSVCEKVLIETTKVFDACVSETTETNFPLTITSYNPANPAEPLTFISASSTGTGVVVSNVVIDRLTNDQNYATVSATITFPVEVTYRDSNGVIGVGQSSVTVARSAVLYVPQPALTPVNISAVAGLSSIIGTWTGENVFTITACIYVILKVTAVVDILVPSYGYPCIPECSGTPTSVCPGVANLPIYPTAN